MSEVLYGLGDIGATNLRIGVYNDEGELLLGQRAPTQPNDYEATVDTIAALMNTISEERGKVVAASIAIAAEVSEEGVLIKAGGLQSWVGRNFGEDVAQALNLERDLVGTPNDVVAVAISQQEVNRRNGREVAGIATAISSGWGGALYTGQGKTKGDEPGHEFLRSGAICACGQEGHAEAFMSGGGIKLNYGVDIEEWLQDPGAAKQLVSDMSRAITDMLKRHASSELGFVAEELRWTGGVALGQPFLMERVAQSVRLYQPGISVDVVTMGEQAGLHGTFIDASQRAADY